MGSALATRLHHAGLTVTVYNRTSSKMTRFENKGISCADSIQMAVNNADLVISCLFDDASVLETITGENGILHHMSKNACYVSTETMLPKTIEKLWAVFQDGEKQYLPAAILGGPKEVANNKATVFTSGNASANKRYETILKLFTEQIYYMGDKPEWAMVMKIAMNYTYVTNLELISELYVFTEKHGIPPEYIQKTLYTVFQLPGFRECIDQIHHRNFTEVNFAVSGGDKDLKVFQQAFTGIGSVPRLGHLLGERFTTAKASSLEDKDWTAIYEIVRNESGLD